ncbi:O-acetylhomoserine aminocarboxypropyltransferase/cysteine synthase family protein [Companilactobacillus ginsenosidimutans]|uniref:homocysteine desulfhydrase n=1 Tax=Companilactobacillus ginsenosidimutans TaxID=1007676 RepID=A0A0H4R2A6_9LACO|nr:aminotransferase class I/II-fold pyridoxal phosphate-dependent enzyme [Companilactobacillus ginsenosidimutans]AKP67865.1 O-acetylhomoserine aminocarboxypropyltransferase [Companilactobacillus ginsenosidimutans]
MTENKFDTKRIHAGYDPAKHNYASSIPIYQNVAFALGDARRGEAVAAGTLPDTYSYSRVANPTVEVFEKRIAAISNAVGAVAVGSGMAAITYTILNTLEGGGRLIAPKDIYGASLDEFETFLPKYNIHTDFVDDINDVDELKRTIKPDTKAIFAESVANPSTAISDVEAIAEVAHEAGIPLIIDNTFCTPYLFNPIDFGADIVVYSSTKGINGHGNVVSGLVVDGGHFDWSNGKFPQFEENEFTIKSEQFPENYSFANVFGVEAFIQRIRLKYLRLFGAVLDPFAAYLELIGLETISERLDKEVSTGLKIAKFLKQNPHVKNVYYSGLPDSAQYNLAEKYFPKGIGSTFSFDLDGDLDNVRKLLDSVKVFLYLPNVGDSRSLIVNPVQVTHREVQEDKRAANHLTNQLLRLSIGLEDSDDLIADLDQAINHAFE